MLKRNYIIREQNSQDLNLNLVSNQEVDFFEKENFEIESELPREKWKSKKQMSISVAEIISRYDFDKSKRVLGCGSWLRFIKYSDEYSDKLKFHSAKFCRERICPMCSWRRSIKLGVQMEQVYSKLCEESKYKFIHLVLTVDNCPADKLRGELLHIVSAFRFLTSKNSKFKNSFCGYYRALEVTYNSKDDEYHPHLHCFLVVESDKYFSGSYIKKMDFVEMWKDALEVDYNPSLWVAMINSNHDESLSSAMRELTKYTLKASDVLKLRDEEKRIEVLQVLDKALYGLRLISFGGVVKEVRKDMQLGDFEDLRGDFDYENDITPLEKSILIYSWRNGIYFLQSRSCLF